MHAIRWFVFLIVISQPASLFAQAAGGQETVGRFDQGKMWTFEYSPGEYFSETYGFDANEAWFERARLAALRVPGCSASFVSPFGLVATNHHCVRGAVAQVAEPGESLLDDGFFAPSLGEERRIPGYYADQLLAAMDVTDEIFTSEAEAADATHARTLRTAAQNAIIDRLREEFSSEGDSIYVQVVPLYNGGRYSAYVFRRFTDVRMVLAVELNMGFFGGDPDNFTYPRYALDFAFLRVYGDDGEPLETEHYFDWGQEGVEAGDVVFVIGSPGPTTRLSTMAQLQYLRDVSLPATLETFTARLNALWSFYDSDPELGDQLNIRNRAFSLSNSLKATIGRLAALNTASIMERKAASETMLRDAIAADSRLEAAYGHVFGELERTQAMKREFAADYAAFRLFGSAPYSSATLYRAMIAAALLEARAEGGDGADSVRAALLRIADHPPALEQSFTALRFGDFLRAYGEEDHLVWEAIGDGSPEAEAARLMNSSSLDVRQELESIIDDDDALNADPAVAIGKLILPRYRAFMQASDETAFEESEGGAQLGRARFAVYGDREPPDASRSPRITDGVVGGYSYNGTLAPPYTTFFGLYDRYHANPGSVDWRLPERWSTPPVGLDLRTPLNFVSTADTYGGNSGSPAVTKDLKLVGLNFDRNIEGLSRDYIYLPERGRNIMVDMRAVHQSLMHVYDAHRLVEELMNRELYESEDAADRARR